MRASKILLFSAPMSVLGIGDLAHVSTTTLNKPVTTKTHTQIVFVTASAGPTVSTCLASVCVPDVATGNNLSTISLTSFHISTTTSVITPPDSTVTITNTTGVSAQTSCVSKPQSTITVTVTKSSLPVITKTVYPPHTTKPHSFSVSSPCLTSTSFASSQTSSLSPPYWNGTAKNSVIRGTNNPSGRQSFHGKIIGAVPDASIYHESTKTAMSYPVNIVGGPFLATAGTSKTSNASALRPPRGLTLLAKLLSIRSLIRMLSVNTMAAGFKPCFYPYQTPLDSGKPPHLTNTPRGVPAANNTAFNRLLETMTTTSTTTFTVIQVPSHLNTSAIGGSTCITSALTVASPSLLQKPNDLTPDPTHVGSITADVMASLSSLAPSISTPQPGTESTIGISSYQISSMNVTIESASIAHGDSVTITSNFTSTIDALNTINATSTIQEHKTSTRTISEILSSTTDSAASIAAGLSPPEHDLIGCAMVAIILLYAAIVV